MIDIANNFEKNFQSNRFYLNFQQLLFNLEMKFKKKISSKLFNTNHRYEG